MITLRPYQQDLVERIATSFRNGAPSVLLQMGTGGGKTATASNLLERAVAKGNRALFVAHLDSLIEDTHERLSQAGVPCGFVQANRPSNPEAPVQVASIATLGARPDTRPPANLVIIDECHRAQGATYRKLLESYEHAGILGLTATPQRGDGKPLGDLFRYLIAGPSNRWLTENDFLVPCEVLAPSGYKEDCLAVDPVKAYAEHAPGQRAIVFAANKLHANQLCEGFRAAGFSSDVVVGETSRARRRELRDRLSTGDLQVLVGVAVFLEGFDCPAIEVVVLARAFGVCGAFLQAIGRGLRPSPSTGKTRCLVLDLRGAVFNHGLPDEARQWNLNGRAVQRTEALVALARCRDCLAVFRPAKRCPRCGAKMVGVPTVPRVLSKAEKLARIDNLPQHERDFRYLQTLIGVAKGRLNKDADAAFRWAVWQFEKRFGRKPTTPTEAA